MIQTERLLLRAWRESDRDPFYRMNADPEVMRYFPAVLSRQESDALVDRVEGQWAQRGFTFYAAELREGGDFIGFIGISVPLFEAPFTPCVETGWRLAKAYWGRGLATEGARQVLHHAFSELGLTEIVAFTVPANRPSRRVMEKIGMTHDPADDFDHPRLPEGHPLRRHVLYRVRKVGMASGQAAGDWPPNAPGNPRN
ncbi:MAG: GNAT family N-acetyltransferase [Candidatus Sulfopaludibacter sp.]|nr:GNAT family N-acetyltransferase [Candidatus Sulfopaludibacter sp.]